MTQNEVPCHQRHTAGRGGGGFRLGRDDTPPPGAHNTLHTSRSALVGSDMNVMLSSMFVVLGEVVVREGGHPCSNAPLPELCRDGLCHPDNEACPPVTTELSCGEHPHSGRDGSLLTWGLSFRAASAQDCCDKCKEHPKKCNSWTFCPLAVCWGLDTGHNHTFGESLASQRARLRAHVTSTPVRAWQASAGCGS